MGDLAPANTARELGISVRQLHLLFGPTGTTFSRYVLSRRLERARLKLALEPRRKILDVAFACGIESSTVFYRAFRDAFGITPTGYRRSLLGTEPAADAPKTGRPIRTASSPCLPFGTMARIKPQNNLSEELSLDDLDRVVGGNGPAAQVCTSAAPR